MTRSISYPNATTSEKSFIKSSEIQPIRKTQMPQWTPKEASEIDADQYPKNDDTVSAKEAQAALTKILKQFSSSSDGSPIINLASLEKIPMESLMLMSTNLGIILFSKSAELSSKAMDIQTETQTALKIKQVKDYQQQLADNIAAADKAKKGGIIQVVFDWTIATAEFAYGASRVLGAMATGDIAGGASGAAYMLAGMSGMVKAIAETLILAGVGDKDKLQEVVDVASKIQLSMEIAGAVLDMYQAGKGVMAAKNAASSSKAALAEAAPKIATTVNEAAAGTITKEVAKESTKAIAQEVSQQLSQQLAQQLVADLPKQVAHQMAVEMSKTLAKEAGEEAIKVATKEVTEELVKESLKRTIQQAIENSAKKAIEKGVEVSAEKLVTQLSSSIWSQLAKSFVTMSASKALNSFQSAGVGAQTVSSAVIQDQIAGIKKEIDKLILQQDFAQWCYQWYDDVKKQQKQMMKDAISKEGDSLKIGSKLLSDYGTVINQIAATRI